MASVYPFRGYRYNINIVGRFDDVVVQPYDKTTPSMQDAYYDRSPYNAVRITLNREKRNDPETGYPDAAATLKKWMDEMVIVQDPAPAMYAYYQEYTVDGIRRLQRGLVSLLDLEESGSGVIPHEHTLAAPKQDRLKLMRSIEANEDFIYMLYTDESLAVNRIVEQSISSRKAEIEAVDEYGAIHRVWGITDPEALAEIQNILRAQNLFIADGHHRFETSMNFMQECRAKGWKPAAVESFNKRMAACFNTADGVTILPTHRMIRDVQGFDPKVFLKSIEESFAVEQVSSAPDLWQKMEAQRAGHVFGFYPASVKGFYLLRLKEDRARQSELDVQILHSGLLERFLGIDEKKLSAQTNVDYVRERELCIRLVDEGKYQAAFFLNPTTAEQMQRIASRGERMPQKSTDFYPKLLTGLLFMKMQIEKA